MRFLTQILNRRFSSALYITGDKAKDHFALLTPHIDFEDQLENATKLETSIRLRELKMDLNKIKRRWYFFKHLSEQKHHLDLTRREISNQISESQKKGENPEKLILHRNIVKEDLKILKHYLYGVEESVMLSILSLPNFLHDNTKNEEQIIYQHLEKPKHTSNSHMEIGKNLIKFVNPFFYFLKSEAALFEYSLINYASDAMTPFTPFSNSDFCRSIVVEGCGTDFNDKTEIFTLQNDSDDDNELSRTHLIGGGSLYSFMSYFTKHIILENKLPLRFFTTGRRYQPSAGDGNNLLNVNQESVLEFFLATKDDDQEMNNEFSEVISKIIKIYEPLGYHFRLVYVPAKNLESYESLCVSIQMYSNFLKNYVEVGHCSIIDSFLSKRLLFTYNVNKQRLFVRIISGTLLRIPPLLACVLENNNKDELLSNLLKSYI